MFEVRVEAGDAEKFRQTLSEGQYHLGRAADNEITIPDKSLSRRHLRLEVTAGGVTLTDLGSTNGTYLDGRRLPPHQPTPWPPGETAQVGPLSLHLRQAGERGSRGVGEQGSRGAEEQGRGEEHLVAPAPPPPRPSAGGPMVAYITCREATPQLVTLTQGAILVGTGLDCGIRPHSPDVAAHHCRLYLNHDQVEVTNLDSSHPAELAGVALPAGQPQVWPPGQPLQVGGATLYVSLAPAALRPGQAAWRRPGWGGLPGSWRRLLWVALPAGGLVLLCLAAVAVALGTGQRQCPLFDLACWLGGTAPATTGVGPGMGGTPTPTKAITPIRSPTPELLTTTPQAPVTAVTTTDCPAPPTPGAALTGGGWLDLPFPYRGTEPEFGGAGDPQTAPELFRRISQRSQFGGRINAFFDHQYPVYPPRVSGWEPISTTTTLLLFDGSLSDDAFSRQDGQGDYYSGHTGIDFAPVDPFNPTTPVLAAAAGRLTVARVDDDGNHWVRLEHDPDGDGRYQYATLYFHLHDDEHFARTLALYEQAASEGAAATGAWPEIQAGERIGTMGTTGRSSGIHLHFEVRYDANKDRFFSRLETVDPYGFFPGPDADPWNAEVDLEDNNGEVQRHRAIASEYLWRHPFIQVEDEMAGDCVETVNVQAQVDLYPVLGWAVIDPGFTFIARNAQGQAVTAADSPRVRRLTVSGESLQGVDRDSIVLVFFDPVLQNWPVVATPAATPQPNGNYTFQVEVIRSAHYVLVGRETSDREPPITTILFSAPLRDGDAFTFEEPVTITLVAEDQSPPGVLAAGVARIQYSPDCGRTWLDYTRPITVTLADRDEYRCGDSGSGEQGIELGANDFIILAIAEDSLHNIQQPASQARFTVIGD